MMTLSVMRRLITRRFPTKPMMAASPQTVLKTPRHDLAWRVLTGVVALVLSCNFVADSRAARTTLLTTGPDVTSGKETFLDEDFASVGSLVFFKSIDAANGQELWVSDGSVAGTHLVKDIWPGKAMSWVTYFAKSYSLYYFIADDGVHGSELWRSDGTAEGTFMLADFEPGPGGAKFGNSVVLPDGRMVFTVTNSRYGAEPWVSDGTQAGTRLLKDINPGGVSSFANSFARFGNRVVFAASDGVNTSALWITDLTETGTVMIKALGTLAWPTGFTEFAGRVVFSAHVGGYDTTWESDGTAAGTQQVGSFAWAPFGECNGKLYFNYGNAGLAVVDPITHQRTRVGSTQPREGYCFNNVWYFRSGDAGHGAELWRSDGTVSGTHMVADMNPGTLDSSPNGFVSIGSALLFKATTAASGEELWRTDGTTGGTVLVKEVAPYAPSGGLGTLYTLNGIAYFQANTPGIGLELWMSDGTGAGTRPIRELFPTSGMVGALPLLVVNQQLIYASSAPAHVVQLWALDQGGGTAVEYYWPARDHYFITSLPEEIAILDAATTSSRTWVRTGRSFNALPSPTAATESVCRFYIPPPFGDSHFYGRGAAECAATHARFPEFIYESPAVMYMPKPAGGVCASGTVPVYRVFDNRVDSNHRYTTDRGVQARMVEMGWVAEGDGPDLVVMCAPQ